MCSCYSCKFYFSNEGNDYCLKRSYLSRSLESSDDNIYFLMSFNTICVPMESDCNYYVKSNFIDTVENAYKFD